MKKNNTEIRKHRIRCDILGWHKPCGIIHSDPRGVIYESKCKYCGREIMQDSQGNWF